MSNEIQVAMDTLKKALRNDPSYALGWHANLKMCFFDSILHEDENRDKVLSECEQAASNFMKLCFDVKTSSDMLDNIETKPVQTILIERCSDPQKWYSGLIGQEVPLLGVEGTEYRSQEPAGFVNFVSKKDGALITRER